MEKLGRGFKKGIYKSRYISNAEALQTLQHILQEIDETYNKTIMNSKGYVPLLPHANIFIADLFSNIHLIFIKQT